MKFCYLDESGTGGQPIAVMVGVVTDTYGMPSRKKEWSALYDEIVSYAPKEVQELHTKDFYRGNSPWRGVTSQTRTKLIDKVFSWFSGSKCRLVYTAAVVSKVQGIEDHPYFSEVQDIWRLMALHVCLSLQKAHQGQNKSKGNTLLVFDDQFKHMTPFREIVKTPPDWTDTYYQKKARQERLDQIIDIPYFCDSRDVGFIQLADFLAYFLRLYLELEEKLATPGYSGEKEAVNKWVKSALSRSIGKAHIYKKTNRCGCADLFFRCAPPCLTS